MTLETRHKHVNNMNVPKIKPLEELVEIRAGLQAGQKRVVHCHGVFDLLYVGVIRHFQMAKELGDVLIVTLVADAPSAQEPDTCGTRKSIT